jgi:hypothetical protein
MAYPATHEPLPTEVRERASAALELLAAGVPLSLLIDLANLNLAKSKDIARTERADASWVHAAGAA